MNLRPIPSPGDLRVLPVVHKTKARHPVAVVAFLLLRALRWLTRPFKFALGVHNWADVVYRRFKQCIGGAIYWFDNYPSTALRGHESVHDWQRRTAFWGIPILRDASNFLEYFNMIWRDPCMHLECMACGYQVAVHGYRASERADLLMSVYLLRKEKSQLTDLIIRYALEFKNKGWEWADDMG